LWNSTLKESIEVITAGLAGKEGGIYSGHISDYDNDKILNCGICFLPDILQNQRQNLVSAGYQLQGEGYKYDLPGLVRQLVRLLTGIVIPQGEQKLLFCSAFLAMVYINVLGNQWNIVPNISPVNITPDDIWYTSPGQKDQANNRF
jgi:hypothetical protein